MSLISCIIGTGETEIITIKEEGSGLCLELIAAAFKLSCRSLNATTVVVVCYIDKSIARRVGEEVDGVATIWSTVQLNIRGIVGETVTGDTVLQCEAGIRDISGDGRKRSYETGDYQEREHLARLVKERLNSSEERRPEPYKKEHSSIGAA